MAESTQLYSIVTGYTYLGIVFYYIIFDFVSPVSDELSLIIIASLAHGGLLNVWAGAVVAFLALYFRNTLLFILSRRRTRLIGWLSRKYPVWMHTYEKQMSEKLVRTVLILTFVPKLRIIVPVAAGLGRVKTGRFMIVQGVSMALFIGIYYSLGVFFYSGIRRLMDRAGNINQGLLSALFLIVAILISVVAGHFIMRRAR